MKFFRYTFFVFLIATVFFVEYDLLQRTQMAKITKLIKSTKNSQVKNLAGIVKPDLNEDLKTEEDLGTKKIESFFDRFNKESLEVVETSKDKALFQKRVKALSEQMTADDVDKLYNLISNEKNKGPERSLALELLTVRNDTASLIALQNFIANNKSVNGIKWDRKNKVETMLRAQAVESIAAYPQKEIALSTLSYLHNKVDERFLIDRIGRASALINKKDTGIKPTSDTELKNILE